MRLEPPPDVGDHVPRSRGDQQNTGRAAQRVVIRRILPASNDGVRRALSALAQDIRVCLDAEAADGPQVCGNAGPLRHAPPAEVARLRDDLCTRAEIVLAEVFNNIVEHACGLPVGRAGDGTISCEMRLAADRLCIVVRDDGLAMPDGGLPRGMMPDLDVPRDNLPEGGFGWHLIRSLTTDLRYQREPGCNRLSFAIPVAPPPPHDP